MMKRYVFIGFVLGSWAFAATGWAEASRGERQVTVQGHGKASAVPDLGRLQVEVMEDGARIDTVTQAVRTKMEAVLKALKGQGIPERDIQTQAYQVAPKVEWKSGRSNRIGYTVSNHVEVKIHDLKKTGGVLAAVLDAGANNVNGPQFELDSPQQIERKALELALQDAKAKALLLAQAAGASLGDVQLIQEATAYQPGPPRPIMAMRAMSAEAAAPQEPIAAGENTLQATVTVAFALK